MNKNTAENAVFLMSLAHNKCGVGEMKRMTFAPKRDEPKDFDASRRDFGKTVAFAVGAVLVSKLADKVEEKLTGFRGTAQAQSVLVKGVSVERITLTDTVQNLDRKSKQYRKTERIFNLGQENIVTAVDLTAGRKKVITLSYPDSSQGKPGYWGFDLTEFSQLVKQVSGQNLDKVRMIAEITIEKGERVVSIYALPLDATGEPIKYDGGYLAVGASIFTKQNKVFGGKSLLYEPKTAVAAIDG